MTAVEEATYREIIEALQEESLGYAANFVTDLLIERKRKDAQGQKEKKENEVEEPHKDSYIGE
jgi:hypothetical protein